MLQGKSAPFRLKRAGKLHVLTVTLSHFECLTFPEISIPISSRTWLTMSWDSSSSPDSSKMSSKVSLTGQRVRCVLGGGAQTGQQISGMDVDDFSVRALCMQETYCVCVCSACLLISSVIPIFMFSFWKSCMVFRVFCGSIFLFTACIVCAHDREVGEGLIWMF